MDKIIVTALLKTPVIRLGYMTLDGILGSVLFDQLQNVEEAHAQIPVVNTEGLFHASAAYAANEKNIPIDISSQTFVASLHPKHSIDYELIKKKKNSADLHMKFNSTVDNKLSTYPKITAEYFTWYVEGDAEKIERLLNNVHFLGKRRASGFGEVDAWSLSTGYLDGVMDESSQPLRPIPNHLYRGDREAYPMVDASWRPAYWNISNRAACYVPFEEDLL
jgi:CRISPR type IV-associated protein Csf3